MVRVKLSPFWNCTSLRAILASANRRSDQRYQRFVAAQRTHGGNQVKFLSCEQEHQPAASVAFPKSADGHRDAPTNALILESAPSNEASSACKKTRQMAALQACSIPDICRRKYEAGPVLPRVKGP